MSEEFFRVGSGRPDGSDLDPDIRRFVRKLLELDLRDVRVASYAELLPEVAIRPVGRATLAGL